MSLCTVLITKKTDLLGFVKDFNDIIDRQLLLGQGVLGQGVDTNLFKASDFINVPLISNEFDLYDVIVFDGYGSLFASHRTYFDRVKPSKIKKFKRRGWSQTKIQAWLDEQEAKNDRNNQVHINRRKELEKVLFTLGQKYFVAFAYFWQGKDLDNKIWQGFKAQLVINAQQEKYDENIVYAIKV